MSKKIFVLLLVALLGLAVPGLQAQITTATLTGTVTDSTGAVVPGAQVTAINIDTNASHVTQSNDQGAYRLEFLPVGNYKLEVTAPNFKKYVRTGLVLEVAQIAQADVGLQTGATSTTVEVNDALPLINVTNPEIGRTVQPQEIAALPLVNRNLYKLLDLTPGVQRNDNSIVLGYPEQRTLINGGVDGGTGSVNYYLDGGNNMTGLRNTGNILPSPDAVQEFRVQTNSYSAEYGRFANGVINVLTKSGTNKWHGSLFEYVRNTIFNANDWGNTTSPKPPLHRNQYGGTVGGPIIHDKTFFFLSYSGLRQITDPFLNGAILPSAAELTGDFSADPRINDPSLAGKPQFPGNKIPANRLDPTAMLILNNLLPRPNVPGTNGWQGFQSTYDDRNEGLIKIDHALSHNHQLALSLFETYGKSTQRPGGNLPWSLQRFDWRQYNANASDTWTVNDHMINQVWLNYTRNYGGRLNLPETSLTALAGPFAGTPLTQQGPFLIQGTPSLPQITVNNFFTLSNAIAGPLAGTNFYSVRDVFSYNHGRHSIKFGAELSLDKDIQQTLLNNYGVFGFNGSLTNNSLADFELGIPNTVSQDSPDKGYTNSWYTAFFVQDDIKFNNRLTVNLGLRYDVQTPPVDTGGKNRESTFIPGPQVGLPGTIAQSTVNPSAPPGLLFAGDPGIPRGIADTRKDHFSPRIGIAWDITGDGKTSLRAGAGVFYGSTSGNQWNTTTNFEPFATRLTFSNVGSATGGTLTRPYRNFPGGVVPFPYNGQFNSGGSIFAIDRNFEWPYTYQLNLSLQRQVTKDWSVMAAYVGSLSHNLPFATDLNYPIITPTASTATANVLSRRPYTLNLPATVPFGQILLMRSNQTAHYHALQISTIKRMGHHFSVTGFYTYGKTWESVQLQNSTSQGGVQNFTNLREDAGRTDDDQRHQFVMSGLWDISYYSGDSSILKWIVNGWNIDPIVTVRSGLPFTVTDGADINLDGTNNDRGVLQVNPATGKYFNPVLSNTSAAQWFNTAAFFTPAGTRVLAVNGKPVEGNMPRDSLTGPGLVQVDMALSRNFNLGERFKLEFRAEGLNVFNHANLNNPAAGVPATAAAPGNFGKITSAATTRVLQLGLRLTF
ncbi:MAG TPA: TonB-dependent receptor [Terriglobales bacterium]|jgi:hypothetical protein|nr:TonB-dependent receptor [Terriglobales bacterium]